MRRFFPPRFTTVSRGPRIAAEHEPFVSARELVAGFTVVTSTRQVYFQFLANVIKAGHADRVVPFPNTTDVGAEFFQSTGFGDVRASSELTSAASPS